MSSLTPDSWSYASSQLSSCSLENLLVSTKPQATKHRKRRSEAGPKSRKKRKIKCSSVGSIDEQILDKDLLGIAGSINTDKNLDSDSSADTIIFDDTDDSPSDNISTNHPCKTYSNSTNLFGKTISDKPTAFNNSSSLFSYSNTCHEAAKSDEHFTMGVASNNFRVKKEAPCFPFTPSLPSVNLLQENIGHDKISDDKKFSISNGSVLKEILTELPPVKVSSFPKLSSTQNTLPNLTAAENTKKEHLKNKSTKKRIRKSIKTSPEISVSVINSVLNNSNIINNFHHYESMGLDEDLCDIDNKIAVKTLNITSKVPCKDILNKCKVSVKAEKIDAPYTKCSANIIHDESGSFTDQKDEHSYFINMDFEAEDEESPHSDEEDNMPLSLLKAKGLVNRNSVKNHQAIRMSNTNDTVDPSLFIKKELIENEIVSESRAISSKSLKSVPNNINIGPSDSIATSQHGPTDLKIKTEPIDPEFIPFDSFTKSSPLISSEPLSKQTLVPKAANLALNPFKKHLSENNNLISEVNEPVAQKSAISAFNSKKVAEEKKSELSFSKVLFDSEWDSQKSNEKLDLSNVPKTKTTKAFKMKACKKKTESEEVPVTENIANNDCTLDVSGKDSNVKRCNDDDDDSDDSDDSELLKNSSKKKVKRKKIDKCDSANNSGNVIDENVPIRYLFKRQSSNSSSPDSFVCTDISKYANARNESNAGSNTEAEMTRKISENSTLIVTQNNVIGKSGTVPAVFSYANYEIMKNKNGKKKQKKKIPKNDTKNTEMEITSSISFEPQFPDQEISDNVNFSTTIPVQKVNAVPSNSRSRSQSSIIPQESVPKDIATVGNPLIDLGSEFSHNFLSDSLSSSLMSNDCHVQETMSTASSQSDLNMNDARSKSSEFDMILEKNPASIVKKKKKRAKSNGWYKKKKPKRKKTQQNEKNVSIPEPAPIINANDYIKNPPRVPVVLINLLPEMEKLGTKNIENNLTSVQELSGGKKKKGKAKKGNKSRKRKKSSVQTNKISQDFRQVDSNESVNDKSVISTDVSKNDIAGNTSVAMSSSDQNNISCPKNGKVISSINIAAMSEEIAAFEAMVQEKARKKQVIKNFNNKTTDACASKTSEPENSTNNKDQIHPPKSIDQSKIKSTILLQKVNTSKSSLLSENEACNAQLLSNIRIKKEILEDNLKSSSNLNTKSGLNDITEAANILLDVASIKKEKNAEQSVYNTTSDSVFTTATNKNDKTSFSLDGKTNSQSTNINSLALSIKKEMCDTEAVLSNNRCIKDQNDLIQKVWVPHKTNSICSTEKQLDPHVSVSQQNSAIDGSDDEIKVLQLDKSKDVVWVDLTDDNSSELHKKVLRNTQLHTEKVNNAAPKVNFTLAENTRSSLERQAETVLVESEKTVSTSRCDKEEKNSVFIVRDKYVDEYFTHPFPPAMISCNKKQRINEGYSRIDTKKWNLSIEKVGSRLRQSESTNPQFGKKLGDIIKLEKYPVTSSEVECYHRILGIDPSHKLLSKCYSPKKFSTNIKKDLNTFKSPQQENIDENKTSETVEKTVNPITCSLSDIIQGITETKMMYCDFSVKDNSTFYDRDCPSTDTRDSFESYVSNVSTKSYNVIQNKNIRTLSNLIVVKENEMDSHSKDACSSGRNSVLSCATPDFQDSLKNDISNIDSSTSKQAENFANEIQNIPYCQRNSLTNFILPQPVVDNTVNTNAIINTVEANSSFAKTCNTTFNTLSTRNNTDISSSPSLLGNYEQVKSSVISDIKVKEESRSSLDIKTVDVDELRKILQTAGTLSSDTTNQEDSGVWKNITTYEYNHTQCIPGADVNSELDESDNTQSFNSVTSPKNSSVLSNSPPHSNSEINTNHPSFTKETVQENSDDDYVDTEPVVSNDSGNEECYAEEDRSQAKAKKYDGPVSIPQYKSKWEKIMERKSQELKEEVNNHFFKDCFPVSSRLKTANKKSNLSDKNTSKSKVQEPEQLNTKELNIKPKKFLGKITKQTEPKSKQNTKNNGKLINRNDNDNTTRSNKKEQSKNEVTKINAIKATHNVDEDCDKTSKLFVPDKIIKRPKKIGIISKSNKNDNSNRCYGNRITNRGTFLTETKSSQLLKSIKIPKKKSGMTKKPSNVRTEEFHSLVKSPEIKFDSTVPKYKNVKKSFDSYKNRDFYKSPLSDNSSSTSSHFVRTKRMRDKQFNYRNSPYMNQGNNQRKMPLGDLRSAQPYAKNETFQDRRGPLLETPSLPSHLGKESTLNRRIPLLPNPHGIPSLGNEPNQNKNAISSHYGNDESMLSQDPVRNNSPSNSSHLPLNSLPSVDDPQMSLFKKIMSVFQNNSTLVSDIDNNVLPVSEQSKNTWGDNNYFGSMVPGMGESKTIQNINTQSNRSISGLFGSVSQSETLDPRKLALKNKLAPIIPIKNQPDPSIDPNLSKLNSPLFPSPLNPVNQIVTPSSRKALYLDPEHLKSLVEATRNPFDPSIDSNSPNLNSSLFSPPSNPVNQNVAPSSRKVSCLVPEHLKSLVGANKNPFDPSIDANSPNLNSSLFTPPSNPVNQIVMPSSRKASCLVPEHLKSMVGRETIETQNVRLLMLEWNVDWLMQQQQFQDPPPICKILKKVSRSYESFEDYYNTYFPLMLLDTWERIYVSWTHLNQASPYSCQIASYSVKNHYVSVECQTVFNTDTHPKGVFPDEGSILMIKYTTKSNEYCIKILGYVTHVKTRRFNSVTDSKLFSSLSAQKDVKPEVLQILTLTFMGAYNSEDIDKRQPVRIHVLCNVKPTLKQNDAMLNINKSPLYKSILNPVVDGLRSLKLIARNSSSEEVNDCVRDITKGILSPHPLPLLTVVCAKPESDRLNIIPQLIEKMKTTYKTKVLLCVRTVRALGDIAANICLNQSLKLVIINKRCDTNPQFQKYLLDELVSTELKKMEEDKSGEKVYVKNEVYLKIKKQILSECDVVLSLIRNSHDDFMCDTFLEKECIPQMCCIVDEANLCTEPETLIPILHGVSKLILIGDPDYTAKVLSKTAGAYDYSKSFFQRAYELDKLEDQMFGPKNKRKRKLYTQQLNIKEKSVKLK